MLKYFFMLQDKKPAYWQPAVGNASHRRGFFNEVEWEKSKQKNVILLLYHS